MASKDMPCHVGLPACATVKKTTDVFFAVGVMRVYLFNVSIHSAPSGRSLFRPIRPTRRNICPITTCRQLHCDPTPLANVVLSVAPSAGETGTPARPSTTGQGEW